MAIFKQQQLEDEFLQNQPRQVQQQKKSNKE